MKLIKNILSTEGIKYAGSKLKLMPHIIKLSQKIEAKTILDGFSGSTRVSQAFAKNGYTVFCNDRAAWSEVFGTCYLQGHNPKRYNSLIEHLNNVKPVFGWFTENYGGKIGYEKEQGKRPWQEHNTQKLDAIREEIDNVCINKIDKCVALTSLILALDKVDSTLGHYVSYLREWSPRSYKSMQLEVPNIINGKKYHKIYKSDIFDLIKNIKIDLAYFDPPYGSNNEKMPASRVRYASYYHIWTTICLNDKPKLFGKVNRRIDSSDALSNSPFEDFRKNEKGNFIAVDAIKELLQNTQAKHIILSYSSGGRATSEELHNAINECGKLNEVVEIDYKKNIMANMKWTNDWVKEAESPNREFLFLIDKS